MKKKEFSVELFSEKDARALQKKFNADLLKTRRIDDQNILAYYRKR